MKIYMYSEAREKLARILEESKTEEVIIRRGKGDMFAIVPKAGRGALRSMFPGWARVLADRRYWTQFGRRENGPDNAS